MQVTISGAFFFSSMFPEANGKNSGLKNEEDQHNMASILSHLVSNKMSILALNYTFWGQNGNKFKANANFSRKHQRITHGCFLGASFSDMINDP